MRNKIDYKYKSLTYFILNNHELMHSDIEDLKKQFHEETNLCGAYLYLDVKSLVLDELPYMNLELYDDHDHTYLLQILEEWTMCHSGGNFWTCLKYKWHDYRVCFDFTAFSQN